MTTYPKGDSVLVRISIPYKGRHRFRWVKAYKTYKQNIGYGFVVGNRFYSNKGFMWMFGFKKLPNLRNPR